MMVMESSCWASFGDDMAWCLGAGVQHPIDHVWNKSEGNRGVVSNSTRHEPNWHKRGHNLP